MPHFGDALVSPKYKLAFETSAKSASMSATAYMQCRFDADYNGTAYEDYTRLMIMREPKTRAISSFLEVAMHYIALLRLPPAALNECVDAWPDDVNNIMDDHNKLWKTADGPEISEGVWPELCMDAFTRNPYTKERIPRTSKATVNLDKATAKATANSALLNALWELPPGCRQLGRMQGFTAGLTGNGGGITWWCDGPECTEPCDVDDETMYSLFGHALSDAARTQMTGCEDGLFGGEHMWPQFQHYARAGRADVVLRLEQIEDDTTRFEHWLESHLGEALPPLQPNCSITSLKVNKGTVLEPALANETVAASLIERSSDLQQRICAMYYHDFTCGGYDLLPACQAPADTWLPQTIRKLLEDAPMEPLTKAAHGHHGLNANFHRR